MNLRIFFNNEHNNERNDENFENLGTKASFSFKN